MFNASFFELKLSWCDAKEKEFQFLKLFSFVSSELSKGLKSIAQSDQYSFNFINYWLPFIRCASPVVREIWLSKVFLICKHIAHIIISKFLLASMHKSWGIANVFDKEILDLQIKQLSTWFIINKLQKHNNKPISSIVFIHCIA